MRNAIVSAIGGLLAMTSIAQSDSGVVAIYETTPEKLWATISRTFSGKISSIAISAISTITESKEKKSFHR